ncbi:DUF2164 family protein [Patescibacteria group bacterium]|nr:DUF2164 family protein [Patescibacteria group bacterium]
MSAIDRNPGLLTKAERQESIDAIIGYFHSERKEVIGVVAAEDILDFFLQNVGKFVFNTGLENARVELRKAIEDGDFRIGVLKQ